MMITELIATNYTGCRPAIKAKGLVLTNLTSKFCCYHHIIVRYDSHHLHRLQLT